MLEKTSLRSDNEDKLVAAVGLYFADLPDEIYGVGPAQTPGKLSGEEARIKQVEIMTEMCAHTLSMASGLACGCIRLHTGKQTRGESYFVN
ncbi:hypothetical protein SAMN05421819_0023 [Bryocella elongata]|uniref:Uncharacterized protein n=1 Tax=Bryocella elongata TaxID=863522 RepID=A0A1H5S1W7_9BACT|nr:hypothetical protein SAMN05421819_0023 [Bryocella elongata]